MLKSKRRKTIKFRYSAALAYLGWIWMSPLTLAADCFPSSDNYLPHVMVKDNGSGSPQQGHEEYQSIVGTNDYIIAGGTTETSGFNLLNSSRVAVVTRIDVPSHVHRWSRTYYANNRGDFTSDVLGMALNNDKVAVWTSNNKYGSKTRGYLFIISAIDGGHLNT